MTSSNKRLQTNLDYLFNDLNVYDDEKGLHAKGGTRRWAKRQLEQFQYRQKDKASIRMQLYYHQLLEKARQYRRKERIAEHAAMLAQGHDSFIVYPTTAEHLEIRDRNGVLLAYRFRIPSELVERLTASEELLKPRKMIKHPRGSTMNRHYGVWKKYKNDPHQIKDQTDEHPSSGHWLLQNEALFHNMSNTLRFLEPEMYKRFTSVKPYLAKLPAAPTVPCGAWYGCAINQGMIDDGAAHRDCSDYYCGINCVTTWGTFTSAKLVLWELGIKVEVIPGTSIFLSHCMQSLTIIRRCHLLPRSRHHPQRCRDCRRHTQCGRLLCSRCCTAVEG